MRLEANVSEAMAQAISDILIGLQATSLIAHSLYELALDTADGSHLPEARRAPGDIENILHFCGDQAF